MKTLELIRQNGLEALSQIKMAEENILSIRETLDSEWLDSECLDSELSDYLDSERERFGNKKLRLLLAKFLRSKEYLEAKVETFNEDMFEHIIWMQLNLGY